VSTCPNCARPKKPTYYLCARCWYTLPPAARRALWRADALAADRLGELHRQIQDGIPLAEVAITR
jgi:hypothetical protein